MIPGWTGVQFPNDAIMPPPAFVRQVLTWALESFLGEQVSNGRIPIRVLRQDHSMLRFGRSCIETPLTIGTRRFSRGLGTHAFSHLVVGVPEGGERFEALVGVDNNEDTAGVRGSVEFAVEANGEELLRTPVLKGGAPPVPLMVRIPPNVTELHLKVTDGGDGVAFDQADWAEAAFVMKDGSRRMLDEGQLDLPMAEDGLPLRFLYGGRSSDELLREWHKSRSVKDEGAWTRMLCRWDEPGDGLSMTVDARLFHRYGAVEWVVYFENRGPRDSAVLEEVWPLHLTLASAFFRLPVVLHHLNGDTCSAESFLPFTTPLEPGKGLRLTPTGGRPSSMTAFPFWDAKGPARTDDAASWSGNASDRVASWRTHSNAEDLGLAVARGSLERASAFSAAHVRALYA